MKAAFQVIPDPRKGKLRLANIKCRNFISKQVQIHALPGSGALIDKKKPLEWNRDVRIVQVITLL
jgi:hypothetical protein